jgi:small subunit ribosomal protein S9
MSKTYATGRRKRAIAKVWLTPGSGEITVNGQSLDQWLGGHESLKTLIKLPLKTTKQLGSVNIKAKTLGGGYAAQADAVKLAVTKALVAYDEEFRKVVKPLGLLTRDPRKVERKKPGRRKARRSPQFSKR